MKQEWKSIRKGSIIQIKSPINGTIIIKVWGRNKAFGYGKIIFGKRKNSNSKHYMFNQLMFNKGQITKMTGKAIKILYGN